MTKINYDQVAGNESLYKQYRNTFSKWFNMQLSRKQYVEFVDVCREHTNMHLNPFSMCAYILKRPVGEIVTRFFQKGDKT